MKLFFLKLNSLLLLAVGAIAVITSFEMEEIDEVEATAIGAIEERASLTLAQMGVGAVLFVVGFYGFIPKGPGGAKVKGAPKHKRKNKTRTITVAGESGDLVIQLDAVERTLNGLVAKMPEVKKAAVYIDAEKDGRSASITVDLLPNYSSNLRMRETAKLVTDCIRETAVRILGIEDIASINVNLVDIALNTKKESRNVHDDIVQRASGLRALTHEPSHSLEAKAATATINTVTVTQGEKTVDLDQAEPDDIYGRGTTRYADEEDENDPVAGVAASIIPDDTSNAASYDSGYADDDRESELEHGPESEPKPPVNDFPEDNDDDDVTLDPIPDPTQAPVEPIAEPVAEPVPDPIPDPNPPVVEDSETHPSLSAPPPSQPLDSALGKTIVEELDEAPVEEAAAEDAKGFTESPEPADLTPTPEDVAKTDWSESPAATAFGEPEAPVEEGSDLPEPREMGDVAFVNEPNNREAWNEVAGLEPGEEPASDEPKGDASLDSIVPDTDELVDSVDHDPQAIENPPAEGGDQPAAEALASAEGDAAEPESESEPAAEPAPEEEQPKKKKRFWAF